MQKQFFIVEDNFMTFPILSAFLIYMKKKDWEEVEYPEFGYRHTIALVDLKKIRYCHYAMRVQLLIVIFLIIHLYALMKKQVYVPRAVLRVKIQKVRCQYHLLLRNIIHHLLWI